MGVMLPDALDTESPDAVVGLPEPEGAAEKDDMEALHKILRLILGKNASDLIKKSEETIKKNQELWAQLLKFLRRLRDGEGIKMKKIGQSIKFGGEFVSAEGEIMLLVGGFLKSVNPEAGAYLIAVGVGMMAAGKGTEVSGVVVQKATDVSINAYKTWKNEDYKIGDVSKGIVRDLTGKDVKEMVRYLTGKDASEYKFGDITRAGFRKCRKMARGRGSRKPPKQVGG